MHQEPTLEVCVVCAMERDAQTGTCSCDAPRPSVAHVTPTPWGPEATVGGVPRSRYILHAELGRGAMGVVYHATDRVSGRAVALKILHRKFLPGSVERTRFLREAQALGAVRHPNVVQVFDQGFDAAGHPFVVMELLYGHTLEEILPRGPMDIGAAVAITGGLLSALAAVHRAEIVHRDIKPGNIIVARVGVEVMVKLVDFGLSRRFGELDRVTASGTAVGTPAYMSPEQIMGEPVGPTSDVYAVGCTLFELLAGRPPYDLKDSKNVAKLFRRILDEAPPLIQELRPEVPDALSRVVSVALHRDRNLRYPNCDSMRRALLEAFPTRHRSGVPGVPDEDDLLADRTGTEDGAGLPSPLHGWTRGLSS